MLFGVPLKLILVVRWKLFVPWFFNCVRVQRAQWARVTRVYAQYQILTVGAKSIA